MGRKKKYRTRDEEDTSRAANLTKAKTHSHEASASSSRGTQYSTDRGRYKSQSHRRQGWGNKGRTSISTAPQTNDPSPQASTSSSGDGNHSSSQSHDSLEIPGFYYDPEKKKYFKILPSQNVNAGAVTKQTIKENKAEMIRQERIQEFNENKSKGHVATAQRRRYRHSQPILDWLERRTHGLNTDLYGQDYLLHKAGNLKPSGSIKLFPGSNSGYDKVEHFRQMIPTADCSKFLCLWTLKETMTQRIQTLKLNQLRKIDEDGTITTSLSSEGKMKLQHTTKVTHMTWAEQSNGENPELQALFTSSCFLGCNPSTAYLFKLNPQQPQQQSSGSQIINPATEMFMLGPQAAWTCSWSKSRAQFSVGTEHCSMLLDVTTRRLWELHTKGQSVHTQAFAPETGNLLYSGTRKGCLFCHDLRSISTRFTFSLNHRTSISHLLPLKDTNYLLASDFSGKILQWDLRKRDVVNSFDGQNEYSHLPFHLDPTSTILYTAGQDCYTRLWDFKTGELLSTIPPPFPASREVIPALCFSLGIGRSPETPALLLGMKDTLHFYA